jgi:hypothetical protein
LRDHPFEFSADVYLASTYASITVKGRNAVHARALFGELKQELERHKYEFSWAARLFHRGPEIAIVTIASVLLFWLWLVIVFLLVAPPLPRWASLPAYSLLLSLASCFVLLLNSPLKKAFPVVRFEGHFLDSGRRTRTILKWLLAAIIIPPILAALRLSSFFSKVLNIFSLGK